jgi:hypothetical protein
MLFAWSGFFFMAFFYFVMLVNRIQQNRFTWGEAFVEIMYPVCMGTFAAVMTVCVVKQKKVGHPDDVWCCMSKENDEFGTGEMPTIINI